MVNVRPAHEADLDRLAQFWYERTALHALPRGVALRPDAREHWRAAAVGWLAASDYGVLTAEQDGELAGFVVCRVVEGPPGLLPAQHGEILVLVLDGHAYHPGAGRALFEGVRAWLLERGVTRFCATIPKASPVEQAFWRALHGALWSETLWWTS